MTREEMLTEIDRLEARLSAIHDAIADLRTRVLAAQSRLNDLRIDLAQGEADLLAEVDAQRRAAPLEAPDDHWNEEDS